MSGFNPDQPRGPDGRWIRLGALLKRFGGFTHSVPENRERTSGFAVAVKGHERTVPGRASTADIEAFADDHADILKGSGFHLGGWYDTESDQTFLDVSEVLDDRDDALKRARDTNELAIYDLGSQTEIRSDSDLIQKNDLSTPDARRSPAVSVEKFREHAKRGRVKLAAMDSKATEPDFGGSWDSIVDDAYAESRAPWGGVTVDAHTGKKVPDGADEYALTIRPPGVESVRVNPSASKEEFAAAMAGARKRFADVLARPGSHLGVFHDEDTGTIDIDPVLVTPRLEDVHDIGAYTRAVGGAYHFKSGDGFWPPHVNEEKNMSHGVLTPSCSGEYDFAKHEGKLAFWKQILPKKAVHYTAKDGTRQQIDFTEEYLTDLASNKAVDKIGFLLADANNGHTMDPDRWRGEVVETEVREDGLYGKIVFPSPEAAQAVLANPDLGVSARIREGVQRSDGSTVSRGLIHVLGTLDPQVSGMSAWQATDLSNEAEDIIDLSDKEYEDMAEKTKAEEKTLADYTEADIDAMTEEELDTFLARFVPELDNYTRTNDEDETEVEETEDETEVEDETDSEDEKVLAGAGADMSEKAKADIELANEATARANARAEEAMRRVADAEWREERSALIDKGVPPHALDLAESVLNRADDMVIDLSNTDEEDVNVSQVVRGLLKSMEGTVDLSAEAGHSGSFTKDDAEDPDKDMLDAWANQS